ncbi:MAG: ABC transporter substrate-binding protein, partial [Acidimicrobiia bacterium]
RSLLREGDVKTGEPWSRRDFLRLTAGAAAATVAACGSGSEKEPGAAEKAGARPGGGKRTLRILQWTHTVPAYDQWFDHDYTQRWGAEHDVTVTVDHVSIGELTPRAATEISAGRGHDLFGFLAPPSAFEDEVIDHREIVEQVAAELGPLAPLAERNVLNPKTKRYVGFPEFWSPFPVTYRTDIWDSVGLRSGPDTWEDVRRAAPALKAGGHPLGFAFSADVDANWSLMSLMHAYGASIQNEDGAVVIDRPATVEALKVAADIYRAGMTEDVFTWDALANNRFMASGTGSMTLNPVSALRAVEKQDPELADKLGLAPVPAGPAARFGVHSVASVYVVWRFAENQELAKQFLVDLAVGYREAFVKSEYFNLPAFPGSVRDVDELVGSNAAGAGLGKYAVLAGATSWSTNIGHPGFTNAAVDEVFTQFIVPRMFAAVAKGETSAEDSARAAQAEIERIFGKWRDLGKL